jgi:hypothetical protein
MIVTDSCGQIDLHWGLKKKDLWAFIAKFERITRREPPIMGKQLVNFINRPQYNPFIIIYYN